jgi:DNA-directed RNA polymerase subunit RPC12/RpoP
MNKKARQAAYIIAMVGAGLVMVGYAITVNSYAIGKAMLAVGCVMLAVTIGYFISDRKFKYCPKCGLKVTNTYIRQNIKRFEKYKCPRCSTRQLPVERPKNV